MNPCPRLRMQGDLASVIANLTPQVLDLPLPSAQSATTLQKREANLQKADKSWTQTNHIGDRLAKRPKPNDTAAALNMPPGNLQCPSHSFFYHNSSTFYWK